MTETEVRERVAKIHAEAPTLLERTYIGPAKNGRQPYVVIPTERWSDFHPTVSAL